MTRDDLVPVDHRQRAVAKLDQNEAAREAAAVHATIYVGDQLARIADLQDGDVVSRAEHDRILKGSAQLARDLTDVRQAKQAYLNENATLRGMLDEQGITPAQIAERIEREAL